MPNSEVVEKKFNRQFGRKFVQKLILYLTYKNAKNYYMLDLSPDENWTENLTFFFLRKLRGLCRVTNPKEKQETR